MKSFRTMISAGFLASALALAGCGGGSESESTMDDMSNAMDMAKKDAMTAITAANNTANGLTNESDEEAVMAARNAITAAVTAIDALDAADQAQYTVMLASAENTVSHHEGRLAAEKRSAETAEEEENKRKTAARNALARKLTAALAKAEVASTETFAPGKLNVQYDSSGDGTVDATDIAAKTLSPTQVMVAALNNWAGKDYSFTDTNGDVYHAVVYNSEGSPTREPFEVKHAGIIVDATGQVAEASINTLAVTGTGFRTLPGDKTHKKATPDADYVSVSGTLDGAAGVFRCPEATPDVCKSHGDGATGTRLSGGWYFIANDGAMTSTPDPDYARFGWWTKDTGGEDVDIYVFHQPVGAALTSVTSATAFATLESKAKYTGGASGKVSVYSPISDNNVAGVFTADAELTADFGDDTAAGNITGTIDRFMVDGEAHDWEVTLKSADFDGSSVGQFTGATSWKIGETTGSIPATVVGQATYEGQLYDLSSSGLPLATAGTFGAVHGTSGNMRGAFGAATTEK